MRTIERTSQLTTCGETHAAQFSRWGLERRSIPPEPPPHRENWRFAALCVAFRSKYTRASSPGGGSSLTRLVSRTPTGRTGPHPGWRWRFAALGFGRNTPGPVLPVGAPPSRALSAGPPPGELGAHPGSTTGCWSATTSGNPGGRHRAHLPTPAWRPSWKPSPTISPWNLGATTMPSAAGGLIIATAT